MENVRKITGSVDLPTEVLDRITREAEVEAVQQATTMPEVGLSSRFSYKCGYHDALIAERTARYHLEERLKLVMTAVLDAYGAIAFNAAQGVQASERQWLDADSKHAAARKAVDALSTPPTT